MRKLIKFDDSVAEATKIALLREGGTDMYGLLRKSDVSEDYVLSILDSIRSNDNAPPLAGKATIDRSVAMMIRIADFTAIAIDPVGLSRLNSRGTHKGNIFLAAIRNWGTQTFGEAICYKDGSKTFLLVPHMVGVAPENIEQELTNFLDSEIIVSKESVMETVSVKNNIGVAYSHFLVGQDNARNIYKQLLDCARKANGLEEFSSSSKFEDNGLDELFMEELKDNHAISTRSSTAIAAKQREFVLDTQQEDSELLVDLIGKSRTMIPYEFRQVLEDSGLSKENKKSLGLINRNTWATDTIHVNNQRIDILNLAAWENMQVDPPENLKEPLFVVSRTGGDEFFTNVYLPDGTSVELAEDLAGIGAGNCYMGRRNVDDFLFKRRATFIYRELLELLNSGTALTQENIVEARVRAEDKLGAEKIRISYEDIVLSGDVSKEVGELIWDMLVSHYGEQGFVVHQEDGHSFLQIPANQYFYHYNKIKYDEQNEMPYARAYELLANDLADRNKTLAAEEQQFMPEYGQELKIDYRTIGADTYLQLVKDNCLLKQQGFGVVGTIIPSGVDPGQKRELADNAVILMKGKGEFFSWEEVVAELVAKIAIGNKNSLLAWLAEAVLDLHHQGLWKLSSEQKELLESY